MSALGRGCPPGTIAVGATVSRKKEDMKQTTKSGGERRGAAPETPRTPGQSAGNDAQDPTPTSLRRWQANPHLTVPRHRYAIRREHL